MDAGTSASWSALITCSPELRYPVQLLTFGALHLYISTSGTQDGVKLRLVNQRAACASGVLEGRDKAQRPGFCYDR